jgi:transposase
LWGARTDEDRRPERGVICSVCGEPMTGPKSYRPWSPDHPFLLPPDPREWLPKHHLAHFVLEVVDALDIAAIEDAIQDKDPRGERPYAPRMMLAILVYGYCTGTFSSRRIERRTYEDVAFRYLAGGQHPEFSTICVFRRNHLAAIEGLFVQIVRISQRAGLAKLGHVSFDGSKVHANASKHKAMSYERMLADEERLKAEVQALLQRAETEDARDDAQLGPGAAVDLPAELQRRNDRLAKIQAAKAALEEEARAARGAQLREQAERARVAAERATDEKERERALARAGRREAAAAAVEAGSAQVEDATPEPATAADALPVHQPKVTREGLPQASAQRNFTDPESRIMERGGEILQGFNCQAAVDGDSQIIVACATSNHAPDTYYLVPMLSRVRANTGSLPAVITADAGYWAPANATWCEENKVDAYISTQRQRRSAPISDAAPEEPPVTPQQKMRAKVASPEGQKIYRRRKCIPEPVFGQIKQGMGFRRFSMRGLERAKGEWSMVCTCHNINKLWRARRAGRLATIA